MFMFEHSTNRVEESAANVEQVRVVVKHERLPGGLPAVWIDDVCPRLGDRVVSLYLRPDLPVDLADKFRAMSVRDTLPGISFDAFTVTSTAAHVEAVA